MPSDHQVQQEQRPAQYQERPPRLKTQPGVAGHRAFLASPAVNG